MKAPHGEEVPGFKRKMNVGSENVACVGMWSNSSGSAWVIWGTAILERHSGFSLQFPNESSEWATLFGRPRLVHLAVVLWKIHLAVLVAFVLAVVLLWLIAWSSRSSPLRWSRSKRITGSKDHGPTVVPWSLRSPKIKVGCVFRSFFTPYPLTHSQER